MRYILSFILLMSATGLLGQSTLRPRGDVNCDWKANIDDVTELIVMMLSGEEYHALYTYAADINDDKAINIEDVTALIKGLLNGGLSPMPSYSGTLPVLFIKTEDCKNIVSKEEYLRAEWWLDALGIDGYQSIGSPDQPQSMQIKGRGNATWTNLDKKSFRLKLADKQPMLGMPANKHWTLQAQALDWMGQVSDALPFEIGRRMGMAWNPHMEPVEVVLNGQYIGMYFLTEKVRIDKDRINITEQKDNETDPAKVTGGWLLEIDNYGEPNSIRITEGNGLTFSITPHTPEVLSDVQREYITNFLQQTNAAIYIGNKVSIEWERYIDIDALAIYYVVQEAVDNPEAFSGSCFMHKERGENTKLVFGPLWDCGSSFVRYNKDYPFNEFIYENMPSYCYSRWISEIVKYPHFQLKVRHYWKQFYEQVYPAMEAYLDAFAEKVEVAGNYDHVRWPKYHGNNTIYRLNRYTKNCFNKKVAWLQSKWGYDSGVDPDPQDIQPGF